MITNNEHAYLIGLFQTDGSLSFNNGKFRLTLELSIKDIQILDKIRTRNKCKSFCQIAVRSRCIYEKYVKPEKT